MNDSVIRLHLPGMLLLFALLLGLGLYLIVPPERVARTLFFPGATTTELTGERRLIPRVDRVERAVGLVVEELILGPTRVDHAEILPRATEVQSVIVVDESVFVDLSDRAIEGGGSTGVSLDLALAALEESILFNFRVLEDVIVTIAGNVPFAPAYRPIGR